MHRTAVSPGRAGGQFTFPPRPPPPHSTMNPVPAPPPLPSSYLPPSSTPAWDRERPPDDFGPSYPAAASTGDYSGSLGGWGDATVVGKRSQSSSRSRPSTAISTSGTTTTGAGAGGGVASSSSSSSQHRSAFLPREQSPARDPRPLSPTSSSSASQFQRSAHYNSNSAQQFSSFSPPPPSSSDSHHSSIASSPSHPRHTTYSNNSSGPGSEASSSRGPASNSSYTEAALGFDSLLGPRPTPTHSTSSYTAYRSERPPMHAAQSHNGNSMRLERERRLSEDEEGTERVARSMMQGLGLSTDASRSNSPTIEDPYLQQQQRRDSIEAEDRQRRRREATPSSPPLLPASSSSSSLRNIQQQQQQQSTYSPFPTASSSTSFAPPLTSSHSSSYFHPRDSATVLSGHPSTSSLGSVAGGGGGGMMSPLSPLVEPFSPATSASGHSGWGAPPGSAGKERAPREREQSSQSSVGGFGSSGNIPPLDLRNYPSGQQPFSSQHPHQHQQPSHSSSQRFSDYASSPSQPQSAFSPPANPTPYVPSVYATSSIIPYASSLPSALEESTSTLHGASSVGGPTSTTMSPSASREGFYAPSPSAAGGGGGGGVSGAGLLARREREIPTDRGGYVRAGYAEASARGAVTSGGVIGAAGGVGTGAGDVQDDISTIFVVGFPEDMLEREFQNMFLFSSGFEAATLKIPATTVAARERERELATAAAVNAAVASGIKSPAPTPYADPYVPAIPGFGIGGSTSTSTPAESSTGTPGGPAYEDLFGHSPLSPNPTGSGGFDTSAPIAVPATSMVPSPLSQLAIARESAGSPIGGARKQIIGFAKFRTRAQALEARDILNGKRVDQEKGNILKAEMAKKNLHHAKRSNELGGPVPGTGPSFPLSSLDATTLARIAGAGNLSPAILAELARQTAAAQAQQQPQQPTTSSSSDRAAFEAFHSVPGGVLAGGGGGGAPSSTASSGGRPATGTGGGARSDYYDESSTNASPALGPGASTFPIQRGAGPRAYSRERTMSASPDYPQLQQQYSHEVLSPTPLAAPHSPMSTSASSSSPHLRSAMLPPSSSSSGTGGGGAPGAYQGKSMLQQLDETFETGPSGDPFSPPLMSPSGSGGSFAFPLVPRTFGSVGSAGAAFGLSGPTSPGLGGAGTPTSNGGGAGAIPRTQNPADMNAPKNTLYVGGLPAILPSLTGPFSAAHLEESLRNTFSRCPGFRRLSYRSKSNGPIVFVEFEDVMYATRALQEMYGNTLGGLVKGGIRLSYSKNPLGVRAGGNGLSSNGHTPSASSSPFDYNGNGSGSNGNSGGFTPHPLSPPLSQHQQQQQQQAQQQHGIASPTRPSGMFSQGPSRSYHRSPPPPQQPSFGGTFSPFGHEG